MHKIFICACVRHGDRSCFAVDTNSTEIIHDVVFRVLARRSRDCAYSVRVRTCCFVNRTCSPVGTSTRILDPRYDKQRELRQN